MAIETEAGMIRRSIALLGIAALLAMGLTACGTNSVDNGSQSQTSLSAPATSSSSPEAELNSPQSVTAAASSSSTEEIVVHDNLPSYDEFIDHEESYRGELFPINGRVTNVNYSNGKSYKMGIYWDSSNTKGEVAILSVPTGNYKTTRKGSIVSATGIYIGLDDWGKPQFSCMSYSIVKP